MSRNSSKVVEQYREQNLGAARIIAADPERYQGAIQEWARLILAKSGMSTIVDTEQNAESPGPLFRTEAA